MICPKCQTDKKSRVKSTYTCTELKHTYRRRRCPDCGYTFTTAERIVKDIYLCHSAKKGTYIKRYE
jgi:transcriptional regulator NrdR family protein